MKIIGALLGIAVFVVGIALVADVFYTAYNLFSSVPAPLPAPTVTAVKAGEATATATSAITAALVDFVKRLLLLLLMSVAGAIIASQGSHLFFRSLAAVPPAPRSPQPSSPAPPTTP